jgi:hypothetical protein
MSDRGVVVTPPIDRVGGGFRVGSLDKIEGQLRQAALYWDKVDVPTSNAIAFGLTPSMSELVAAGVLQQSHVPHKHGSFNSDMIIAHALGTPIVAFERRRAEDLGAWSLMSTGTAYVLPDELAQQTRSVEIELYDLLPVPDANVPVDKILAFKSKRADELAQFRAAMDDLYQKIRSARDTARAFTAAAEEINRSVANTFAAMNESFPTKLLSSMKVELTAGHLTAAVGAGLAGLKLGWPAAVVGVGAALVPAIKIRRPSGKAPRGNLEGAPFSYVHGVIRDLLPLSR